ncbi:MAG: nitrous oxide reductase accessory protein NosL [Deltaproteobacteria bacterium]|nr:nitrous oxide reductase accessory protein NosL [Deltaproteobacteria bacterium]
MRTSKLITLGLAGLVGLTGGFGWLLVRAQALPTAVVPVVWDKEACAQCRMHVGEPAFAGQIQVKDGRVLNFDDPGCLIDWMTRHSDPIHAVYFHHFKDDRWISKEITRFVEASPTPMSYGLGAVDGSTTAMSWDDAVARVLKRKSRPK